MNSTLETSPAAGPDLTAQLPAGRVLAVRGLVKQFQMHLVDGRIAHALCGVDLDVEAGDHVALAGPSGAGKSTLLRCVYRTYLTTSGAIGLRTSTGAVVDIAAMSDWDIARLRGREIGYVSQFLRAEPRRPILEIVARAGVARGMDRAEALDAARVALRRVGIDEALWPVHATVLSGGQKQRVNIAAGTISPPRLLLLDEPVSALDPVNRGSVLELIADLRDRGVAILSVFHDLEAIELLATKVVVIHRGLVTAAGDPREVLRRADENLAVAR